MASHEGDFSLLRQIAKKELIHILEASPGPKDLVIEDCLMKPLDKFAGMSLLRQHETEKIFKLDRNNPLPWSENSQQRFYLVRPKMENAKFIADHVNSERKMGGRRQFVVVFVPRKLHVCEMVLEQEGVHGEVEIQEFNHSFIPLESDLLSLELPEFFPTYFLDSTSLWVHTTARALWHLQSLFGVIPRVIGIGRAAEQTAKLIDTLSWELGEPKGPFTNYITLRPRVYANGALKKFLLTSCPSLRRAYQPPWFLPWGWLHTGLRQFIKHCPAFPYEREILKLDDGGQVGLDWLHPNFEKENAPILLVLPGLTGTSFESYILLLLGEVQRLNYRVVVFNNRGNGGVALLTDKTYSAAYTEDLAAVIRHVSTSYPRAPLMALGFSLGGMILFNYLAKSKSADETGLKAAMTVSSPWNPFDSTKTLESFWPRFLFNRRLAHNLCSGVIRNRKVLENAIPRFDFVLESQLIREFDERFIVPMFQYADVDEYYHDAALYYKVHSIPIPTICLNAADDCFAPMESIPFEEVEKSENVAAVITSHGGHIAFLKDVAPDGPGLAEEILVEFSQAVFRSL